MTGNPVVWWGALLGLAVVLVALVAAQRDRWSGTAWAVRLRERGEAPAFLLLAYRVNSLSSRARCTCITPSRHSCAASCSRRSGRRRWALSGHQGQGLRGSGRAPLR